MKLISIDKLLLAVILPAIALLNPQLVQAQLPTVVNGSQTDLSVTETPKNTPQVVNASGSSLKVSCQDQKTVVQKGDRQAVMLSWNYDGFGKEYTPEKRCQIVSERLQQAANVNGGTFKDLQLASGTVNSQMVVCALPTNSNKCNNKNLLFTLKPENARNPDAVIQKIFSFAQDGSASINESAGRQSKVDLNLGNWEQKAFPPKSAGSAPVNRRSTSTGF
jgi:Circadian oscillating protein COP23